jgi:hypothetical protein
MKRRSYLKTMLAAGASLATAGAQEKAAKPIVLYCDLSVDPAKEQEMIRNFHTIFKPAAVKHEGYIDVKICKIRSALQGKAPAGINYRFELTYKTEELRQQWVASAVHKKAWPTIENTLTTKDYPVLLCDSI